MLANSALVSELARRRSAPMSGRASALMLVIGVAGAYAAYLWGAESKRNP